MASVLVVLCVSFVFSMPGGLCVRGSLVTSLCVLCGCVRVMLVSWDRVHCSTPIASNHPMV